MNKKYFLVGTSLLVSLFIYLFYRTSKTAINEIVIRIISVDAYSDLKIAVINAIPLNDVIIYSLPEGLWIFSITLISKPYYVRLKKWNFELLFLPIIFCLGLELLQLAGLTNGRFDLMDVGISILFWILGCFIFNNKNEKQEIFTMPASKALICLVSYSIVYLAHVFK